MANWKNSHTFNYNNCWRAKSESFNLSIQFHLYYLPYLWIKVILFRKPTLYLTGSFTQYEWTRENGNPNHSLEYHSWIEIFFCYSQGILACSLNSTTWCWKSVKRQHPIKSWWSLEWPHLNSWAYVAEFSGE